MNRSKAIHCNISLQLIIGNTFIYKSIQICWNITEEKLVYFTPQYRYYKWNESNIQLRFDEHFGVWFCLDIRVGNAFENDLWPIGWHGTWI